MRSTEERLFLAFVALDFDNVSPAPGHGVRLAPFKTGGIQCRIKCTVGTGLLLRFSFSWLRRAYAGLGDLRSRFSSSCAVHRPASADASGKRRSRE
jgi:hypothetical protein